MNTVKFTALDIEIIDKLECTCQVKKSLFLTDVKSTFK